MSSVHPSIHPTFSNLIRRESMLVKPRSSSAGLNLRTGAGVRPGGGPGGGAGGGRLSRAMSFKHPERLGQIPPMEITRKLWLTLSLKLARNVFLSWHFTAHETFIAPRNDWGLTSLQKFGVGSEHQKCCNVAMQSAHAQSSSHARFLTSSNSKENNKIWIMHWAVI